MKKVFEDLKNKLHDKSDTRVIWKAEPDAFIPLLVTEFARIHSKALEKDEDVIFGTNLETGEDVMLNAYGMLSKRLKEGHAYGVYCVNKTDKGYLFRIEEIESSEDLPF